MRELTVAADEMLYSGGNTDCSLYFLKSGQIELLLDQTSTSLQIVDKPNDSFGTYSFFTGDPGAETALSVNFSTVYAISRDEVMSYLQEYAPDDHERFCDLRDRLTIYDEYEILGLKCASCGGPHQVQRCPEIHYCAKKLELCVTYMWSQVQFRKKFKRRRQQRTTSVLAKINQITSSINQIKLSALDIDDPTKDGPSDEKVDGTSIAIRLPEPSRDTDNQNGSPTVKLIRPVAEPHDDVYLSRILQHFAIFEKKLAKAVRTIEKHNTKRSDIHIQEPRSKKAVGVVIERPQDSAKAEKANWTPKAARRGSISDMPQKESFPCDSWHMFDTYFHADAYRNKSVQRHQTGTMIFGSQLGANIHIPSKTYVGSFIPPAEFLYLRLYLDCLGLKDVPAELAAQFLTKFDIEYFMTASMDLRELQRKFTRTMKSGSAIIDEEHPRSARDQSAERPLQSQTAVRPKAKRAASFLEYKLEQQAIRYRQLGSREFQGVIDHFDSKKASLVLSPGDHVIQDEIMQ
jgi:hypothetical protein